MKKNLLIFIPSIEGGGVEKNLYVVSNYFNKNNINVEILTCNHEKSYRFNKGINLIGPKSILWQKQNRIIKYFFCLFYLFLNIFFSKRKKLIFAFQANIYAIFIAKLLNVKIITRSNAAPAGWTKNYLKKIIYKYSINLADDVMVNSLDFQKNFFKTFSIKPKCIFNPFDIKFVKENLKKKIFISFFNKKFINILSVGRLTDQKDQITILKAIKLLKKNIKVRLIIIGRGQKFSLLNNFIKSNNIEDKVKLVGYKKNPFPYIERSNIIILSSKYEGLPNILLEAQYLKKYIISTNCPTGPKEILINGKAGDLINVGDYKKMSYLIGSYHIRKKMIKKMIKTGFKNFNRFDFNLNCKKYLNFINNNF